MQDDPTTDNINNQTQEFDMDREDWEIAFQPFEGHPSAALRLGFNLAIVREYLDGQLFKYRPVLETLDDAMEALFPFTDFHKASYRFFIRLIHGKLTHEEEQMLNALGVKF